MPTTTTKVVRELACQRCSGGRRTDDAIVLCLICVLDLEAAPTKAEAA